MARNVIYFNSDNNGTLADIVGLPYTDVIVCFLRPNNILSPEGDLDVYGDGAAFVDGNLQGNIQALQNAGKNVLVSFGGDPTTISSSDWYRCSQNVRTLVNSINMFVLINGFNGVDIDYEDDAGFQGGYDGVKLLTDLTSGLANALPPGHPIGIRMSGTARSLHISGYGSKWAIISRGLTTNSTITPAMMPPPS